MYKLVLTALILAATLLWSAAKPDYSGVWKLDPLRSRLDKTEDTKLVLELKHQDPTLRVTWSNDKGEGEVLNLTTDGAEHEAKLGGQPVTAAASWDDRGESRLILTIRQKKENGEQTTVREFKLGDKGKILTTVLSVKTDAGEKRSYEFFTKQ